MSLLRLVAIGQGVVVALWVLVTLTTPPSFSSVYQFFLLVLICGACWLLTLWQAIFLPETRRLAAVVVATPLAALSFVWAVNAVVGLPALNGLVLLVAVPALALGGIVFLPWRVTRLLPAGLVESRRFNAGLLTALLLVIAAWIVPSLVAFGVSEDSWPRSVHGHDWLLMCWIGVWFASVALAPASLLYGYLGLFRAGNEGSRRFHVGQMAAALVVIGILVPATWLTSVALVNPG